jgi:glycosyltransferase involved in cell wall biosynthesis
MKTKLLIIHNRLVVGGPALDIIPLAYHLRNEFDIHILYGQKEADETEPSFMLDKYEGLTLVFNKWLQRSLHPAKDYKAYRFIKKYIAQFRPDIVHTHGAKVGLFGRLAAHRLGVPLIIHTFHGHFFHSYFNRFLTKSLVIAERRLLKITDHVIAISATQKNELEKILRVKDADKIRLIPLGVDYIDTSMKDHYRQAFKRSYRVADDTVCIGLLGRLVGIKNPHFFIDVVEYVLQHCKDHKVKFFIAGDGYEKPGMKRRFSEKNIHFTDSSHEDTPVIFTSWVQNIQNILEGMDVVVLTSFNEGTPMSLIEAQLSGKPVVAVNVGGVKDTMIAGETGFLIPGHDLREFGEALIRLVKDKALRGKMGERAKGFAALSFSKEKEIENFRNLYHSYKLSNIVAGHE